MSIDSESSVSQPPTAGANGFQVLELVAATVSWLPKSTLAALRLTSKATKLAVDHATKKLFLSLSSAEELRVIDSPLLSELTSLNVFTDFSVDALQLYPKAVAIAIQNHRSLESLSLFPVYGVNLRNADSCAALRVALAPLGALEWPKLNSLCLRLGKSTVSSLSGMFNAPYLTELKLNGHVDASDITALSNAPHLASNLKVLYLFQLVRPHGNIEELFGALRALLNALTNLKRFSVSADAIQDLGFLATDIPSLEFLCVSLGHRQHVDVSLSPITSFSRPNLRSLTVMGGTRANADLAPIVSSGAASLPALKSLDMSCIACSDWSPLRELGLSTLTALSFGYCKMDVAAIAHLGSGLVRLPKLESLTISVGRVNVFHSDAAMEALLSGAVLPRLRRLATHGSWNDTDESLQILIDSAYKIPFLENLETAGSISAEGFAALAEAGRQGRWPRLKVFQIKEVVDDNGVQVNEAAKELCFNEMRAAWLGVRVSVSRW